MKRFIGAALSAAALLAAIPAFAETTLTVATVNNGDMLRMQGQPSDFEGKIPDI